MNFKDLVSLSTRMFKTRPMRTSLTILGVSVGIGAVLFLVSLGYGLQNVILDQITTADSLLSLDVSTGNSDLITLDETVVNELEHVSHVVEVSRLAILPGQFHVGTGVIGDGVVRLIDPSYFRLDGVVPAYGNLWSGSENKAVVSSAVAVILNVDVEDMVGANILITTFKTTLDENGDEEVELVTENQPYQITGVIRSESSSFVYIPRESINGTLATYNQVKLRVSSDQFMNQVRGEVLDKGFIVASLSDTIEQATNIFRVVQIILGLFGFVALIVSAIGMFNTMTITLLERTNEIGIMRSVGVAERDVKSLFLMESIIMGFLGGFGGIVLGYLGGEVANIGLNVLARNFGGQVIDIFDRPLWFLMLILSSSILIGWFTGIFPSRRAAKLNPLDALRYK